MARELREVVCVDGLRTAFGRAGPKVPGFGLALATILFTAAVPLYRRAVPAVAALSALAPSVYAMVASLTTAATCP